jgi:hypothetical protein
VQLGFGVLSDVVIQGLRVRQTVQEELSLTSHGRHCHRCPMPDIPHSVVPYSRPWPCLVTILTLTACSVCVLYVCACVCVWAVCATNFVAAHRA